MNARSGGLLWFAIIGMIATVSCARTSAAMAAGDSLKDAYKDDFLIGVALGGLLPNDYSQPELAVIKSQFNAITPENCMKPEEIHPKEKIWDFEEPDALVKFGQENNMEVFGHTLVWHNQTPGWFFADKGKPVTREKLLERMKTHIDTVVGRYKGKIKGWDVVNEASPKAARTICVRRNGGTLSATTTLFKRSNSLTKPIRTRICNTTITALRRSRN